MQARPALVLNADFRPLSYFPLSLLSWQDAITAVFNDHVAVVAEYDNWVSSPSTKMRLPSVVALTSRCRNGSHSRGSTCSSVIASAANTAAKRSRRRISAELQR